MENSVISPPRLRLHVVFGSGGTKTLLAGAGAVLAFDVGGIDQLETIGAASGGSFIASILARKLPPKRFLPEMIDTDFAKLLAPRVCALSRLLALLNKFRHEQSRPRRGVYSVKALRHKVNALVPTWPERLWIVASGNNNSQILFTWKGVYRCSQSQQVELISSRPPAVGLAVTASCGIPGILDSTKYRGELLFDGALSGDGDVPVDVIPRHFGQQEDSLTIAMDTGEDPIKKQRWLRALWHLFSGSWNEPPIDGIHPKPRPGLLLLTPNVTGFHPLQWKIKRDLKWKAIVSGFVATANAICDHNLASNDEQSGLRRFVAAFERLAPQVGDSYCESIEQFLRSEGLLEADRGGQS